MSSSSNIQITLPADHPAGEARRVPPILRFFDYEHLPPHLQAISKPFGDLAREMAFRLPDNAENSTMLRKLLEAKDCAVRAIL